jgi:hypothetical protein
MISPRYSVPVMLLLVLALVPTVIHSYMQSRDDDGRKTAAIPRVLADMPSTPYRRHTAQWVKGMFDSEDWIERIHKSADGSKVRLFVARSYDHKRLYHHPELGLSHGNDLNAAGVVSLQGEGRIPVHLLRGSGGKGVVAYVMLYDGRYIQDPLRHQLGESLTLLTNPRRAMTLFYVDDATPLVGQDFAATPAARLLGSAIQGFLAQPGSGISK